MNDTALIHKVKELNSLSLSKARAAKIMGVNMYKFTQILNASGIAWRFNRLKWVPNEKIFDTRDPNLAYFLGMLLADGYIDEQRGRVQISQVEQDKDIIYFFAEYFFGQPQMVQSRAPQKPSIIKTTNRILTSNQRNFVMQFTCQNFVSYLKSIGITTRKSFTCIFPKIDFSESCLRAFVRGVWDGDGCFYYSTKAKNSIAQVIGSPKFISALFQKLTKLGFDFALKHENCSKPMSSLWLRGNRKVVSFVRWLYDDKYMRGQRKEQKANRLIEEAFRNRQNQIYGRPGFSFRSRSNKFEVKLRCKGNRIYKSFKTAKEAQEFVRTIRASIYPEVSPP